MQKLNNNQLLKFFLLSMLASIAQSTLASEGGSGGPDVPGSPVGGAVRGAARAARPAFRFGGTIPVELRGRIPVDLPERIPIEFQISPNSLLSSLGLVGGALSIYMLYIGSTKKAESASIDNNQPLEKLDKETQLSLKELQRKAKEGEQLIKYGSCGLLASLLAIFHRQIVGLFLGS